MPETKSMGKRHQSGILDDAATSRAVDGVANEARGRIVADGTTDGVMAGAADEV